MPIAVPRSPAHFWRIASATFVSLMLLVPSPAQSLSPQKWSGEEKVSFPIGSAQLSPLSAVLLARHLPRMNALELEVIIIDATGDHMMSAENEKKERSLALARANSVRQFFIKVGYPERWRDYGALQVDPEIKPLAPTVLEDLFHSCVVLPAEELNTFSRPCVRFPVQTVCRERSGRWRLLPSASQGLLISLHATMRGMNVLSVKPKPSQSSTATRGGAGWRPGSASRHASAPFHFTLREPVEQLARLVHRVGLGARPFKVLRAREEVA